MTLRGRFFWKILIGHVVLAVAVLGISLFLLVRALDRLDTQRALADQSESTARLEALVAGRLDAEHQSELAFVAHSLGTNVREGTRITFILPDGTVVADSEGDPERMDSHADRPEFIEAMRSGTGWSTRWSSTVSRRLGYVARRIGSVDAPEGVVRVAVAVDRLGVVPAALTRIAWWLVIIAALGSSALAVGLAALWSDRINRLTNAAQHLARGDLGAPIKTQGHDEVAMLARALIRMRDRFSRQLDTLEDQRAALESILARLDEGILVIEGDGHIALINQTARSMLGIRGNENDSGALSGLDEQTIELCIPNHELLQLLSEPRDDKDAAHDAPAEIRLDLPGASEDRTVLASVVPLELRGRAFPRNPRGSRKRPGAAGARLLVLTDVTELTRTIKIKTDFVAHASHELRTPLTAIRGAVETLMQMDLEKGDPDAPRFLEMLGRHSKRLEDLATDLLSLARVEAGARRFEKASLVLKAFRSELEVRWHDAMVKKQLEWNFTVPSDLHSFHANAYLLNLVLDNLLENAVKFTPPKGRITVRVERETEGLSISVRDTGCGIPIDEQSRVFERFYQSSQTRAVTVTAGGPARGTGLGLSIVRHAVRAMGGTVTLESEAEKGTTITVHLPQTPSGKPAGQHE